MRSAPSKDIIAQHAQVRESYTPISQTRHSHPFSEETGVSENKIKKMKETIFHKNMRTKYVFWVASRARPPPFPFPFLSRR